MNKAIKQYIENFVQPTDDEYAFFGQFVQYAQFQKNALLHQAGEVCNRVYLVLDGILRYYYINPEQNHEGTTWFVSAGDLATDVYSLLSRNTSYINIIACTPVSTAYISADDLERVYASSITWERFGRLSMAQYLVESEYRNHQLQFQSASERYASLLEHNPNLVQNVPLSYIASYLGISLETLSRIRAKR
jgi:CRP/FNR family transcriptional regulator, anaerobic regulatory protein